MSRIFTVKIAGIFELELIPAHYVYIMVGNKDWIIKWGDS